jgi:hypothetical protein
MIEELMKISENRENDVAEDKQVAMAMFERMCQLHEQYISQINELNKQIANFVFKNEGVMEQKDAEIHERNG